MKRQTCRQNAMARLRWLLWFVTLASFVYMIYTVHKLDTLVNLLTNEKRSLPYDTDHRKGRYRISSGDGLPEQLAAINVEELKSDNQPSTLAAASQPIPGKKVELSGNQSNKAMHTSVLPNVPRTTTPATNFARTERVIPSIIFNAVTPRVQPILPVDHVTKQPITSVPSTSFSHAGEIRKNNTSVQKDNAVQKNLNPSPSNQNVPQLNNSSIQDNKGGSEHLSGVHANTNYSVDTPGCKIPLLNPFDPSMLDLLTKPPPLDCRTSQPPLLITKGNKILRDASAVKYYGNIPCSYQAILRRDDDHSILDNVSFPINEEALVPIEFVKAVCYNTSMPGNPAVYTEYFPFIIKKPSVENRVSLAAKSSPGKTEQLSILLLGIDSTSRNQFIRHLPKTLAFLRSNLTSIDLQGYNKVGSNTYPNMMPLLTGHLMTELPNVEVVPDDVLPLVWKNYSQSGYRTQYGEDVPSTTLFNYGKKGFTEVPTDYYLRPYSEMVEWTPFDQTKWGCLGSRLETSLILKWTEEFFDTFPQDPLFSFIYFTRLSHENFTTLVYSDQPILDFLQHMQVKGHLNRTIVFMFGDHGFRFGGVRERFVGRLEEKLPAMFIAVPGWFPGKYPKLYQNLKSNERRLTTPFDVYETMSDLLHLTSEEKKFDPKSRGFSLFSPIPDTRICADAAIDAQWCSCTDWKVVDVKDSHVIQSVALLIERINNITLPNRALCAEVALESVMDARVHSVAMGEDWSHDTSNHYQIVFRVNPSGGVFEGTVWYYNALKTFSVDGIVDRLNLYRNQSACVHDASLKPFCYCH